MNFSTLIENGRMRIPGGTYTIEENFDFGNITLYLTKPVIFNMKPKTLFNVKGIIAISGANITFSKEVIVKIDGKPYN
jgi:hypothetical protein